MGRSWGARVLATVLFSMVAAVFLCGLAPSRAVAGGDGDEAGFLTLVNQERAARGLGRLAPASDLVTVARRHSARMAARDEVFHNPGLASEVDGWELVGENVGVGPTVGEIHDALMASKVHRDVILDPRFTQLGVGVVVEGPDIWLTEVFRLPEAQPESTVTAAGPAEAPAAGEAEPSAPPATAPPAGTGPPIAGAGAGAGTAGPARDGESVTGAAAAPAESTASSAPARRPASALRRLQVAGRRPPLPATEEAASPAVPAPSAVVAPPALPTAPLEPLDIDDIDPQAIGVPLPKPADIPKAGLVAAGLLLLVVGSASATTRRVVAS